MFGDSLFVFTNRARNKIKALYWHLNGFCLWYKRLEQERFAWPRVDTQAVTHKVNLKELEWLLEGFDLWANRPHKVLKYQATS